MDIPLKASKLTLNSLPPFISGKAFNDELFLSKLLILTKISRNLIRNLM